jgi:hypothetical protein
LGEITTGFDPAMKFAAAQPYADPEAAARKLIEIANSVEAVQDGRIHIELINGPLLFASCRMAKIFAPMRCRW